MARRARKREIAPGYVLDVQVEGKDRHELERMIELVFRVAAIQARGIPQEEKPRRKKRPCGCSGS